MQPEPEFEITVLENPGGLMSKRIYLSDDGRVISDGSACVMPSGIAKRIKVTLAGFGALISSQPSQQAIALGVLRGDLPDRVQIVTKHRLQQMNGAIGPDIIARTADFIVYRPDEPGLMLGDYDQKGMPPEVKQRVDEAGGFLSALKSVLPALEGIGRVVRPSTSAGLYREDTRCGLRRFGWSARLHSDCRRIRR